MTIFTVFFAVLVANFEFAGLAPKQKYTGWTVPWKWSVLQNPDRERTNQSTGICLRLGLPYNNLCYFSVHPGVQMGTGEMQVRCAVAANTTEAIYNGYHNFGFTSEDTI